MPRCRAGRRGGVHGHGGECVAGSAPSQSRSGAERGLLPHGAVRNNNSLSNTARSQRDIPGASRAGPPGHKAPSVPSLFPTTNSLFPYLPALKSAFPDKASVCPGNSPAQKLSFPTAEGPEHHAERYFFPHREITTALRGFPRPHGKPTAPRSSIAPVSSPAHPRPLPCAGERCLCCRGFGSGFYPDGFSRRAGEWDVCLPVPHGLPSQVYSRGAAGVCAALDWLEGIPFPGTK